MALLLRLAYFVVRRVWLDFAPRFDRNKLARNPPPRAPLVSACDWARQTPVMDLHQGSNDYNPLRSKPVTAAMKQDQKHIESSVYDPRTGKTVVSVLTAAPRSCCRGGGLVTRRLILSTSLSLCVYPRNALSVVFEARRSSQVRRKASPLPQTLS